MGQGWEASTETSSPGSRGKGWGAGAQEEAGVGILGWQPPCPVPSPTFLGTPLPAVLESPRDLQFSEIGETSAQVSWMPPASRVDSFKVSYQLADGGDTLLPMSSFALTSPAPCALLTLLASRGKLPSPLCLQASRGVCGWMAARRPGNSRG